MTSSHSEGYITSDSDSVADAVNSHHYVADAANASCMAVRDGGDDVDSGSTYYDNLARGVSSGMCKQADVDTAVRNTMRVRFEMGLFDPTDDQPLTKLNTSDVGTKQAAELSLRGVAESLVLLKNDKQLLPLRTGKNIAVVGPHANASRFLIQVDTGTCSAFFHTHAPAHPRARGLERQRERERARASERERESRGGLFPHESAPSAAFRIYCQARGQGK